MSSCRPCTCRADVGLVPHHRYRPLSRTGIVPVCEALEIELGTLVFEQFRVPLRRDEKASDLIAVCDQTKEPPETPKTKLRARGHSLV